MKLFNIPLRTEVLFVLKYIAKTLGNFLFKIIINAFFQKKENVEYTYNEILFTLKKEISPVIYYNMDES